MASPVQQEAASQSTSSQNAPSTLGNGDPAPSGTQSHDKVNDEVAEVPIPQPPEHHLLKNFPDMDKDFPTRGLQRLANLYGPIVKVNLGTTLLILSSHKLINEACDQERFHKNIGSVTKELRALTGDGLFTSQHEDGVSMAAEPNWWKAHRLLVPAFGPLGIRKMFDDMLDISSQMILKWDRQGSHHAIDCSDDFTRLAFDTIGLCGFGYRFNEFYSDEAHPFAQQMSNVLRLSGRRANRTQMENMLHRWEEQDRQADVVKMHKLASEIVQDRKDNPNPDAKDVLNAMLNGADRETGEKLDFQNIVYNIITFLVAGHETTSATLSFLWYHLLRNPEKFHKAQKEVDDVVGDNVLTVDMVSKLHYLDACIKETLRLSSPIGSNTLEAKVDTLLDGRYRVRKGDMIQFNLKGLHHDPTVWGEDHEEFKPERMLSGEFQKLPANAWKPFGTGIRACIGRGLAEQEMLINTALVLQRFQPEMADQTYELKLKSTLTIKPQDFFMKVRRRLGKSMLSGIPGGIPSELAQKHAREHGDKHAMASGASSGSGKQINIYYGGNSGTCEGFAQNLETQLAESGIQSTISSLDAATEHLSKEAINVIITASYEGKPPDNAKKFVTWLESLSGKDTLKGVEYSVMGVGNSDWASTFHRIPKLVDERLQALGAERIAPSGWADAKSDLMGPWEDWAAGLVESLIESSPSGEKVEKSALKVTVDKVKLARALGDEKMGIGTVLVNRQLADTSMGPAKMHMEVRLPEHTSYVAGDYLVVQPRNPLEAVHRIMKFFEFSDLTLVSFQGSKKKFLPTEPVLASTFLRGHVELSTVVTKRQLKTIMGYAKGDTKQHYEKLQGEDAYASLLAKRYSIMDILEEHQAELPFEVFADMLVPLTPRQYSISSSPLATGYQDVCSITYDVHTAPAKSGHGVFEGVCSSYLDSRSRGDQISCFVRSTNVNFRLPGDPAIPVMMFGSGTGIAPLRSFTQERAAIAEAGARKLGPALLFFGCRDAEKDFLYKDELAAWEKQGVVKVYSAHSRSGGGSGGGSHPKYVQDALWEHREECKELFLSGGKILLCGSAARLGKSCADTCMKIYMEGTGKGESEAKEWLESVKTDRYVSDVY